MTETRSLSQARILILIGGHLAGAPRPQKEARALQAAGAQVSIRGVWSDPTLAEEDLALARDMDVDFSPYADVRPGVAGRQVLRFRQRLAREAFARLGWTSARAFGPGAPEALRAARRARADLTMVHSEAGLWVGRHLLEEGFRVGVDFEDWFSQDLPLEDRKTRPVADLQRLERLLLNKAHCCLTTTRILAENLAQDAGSSRVPIVIPNCFPVAGREAARQGPRDPKPQDTVSFYWFSQTIGKGRGLETLARALPLLEGDWQLSIRGSLQGREQWFENTFPAQVRRKVQILDRVPNSELLARALSHDVGLALEEPDYPNHDLTASNKIFDYLRAELAVIATRTRGQAEVMATCPETGLLVEPSDPAALAAAMQRMVDDPALLAGCKRSSTMAGAGIWAWESHAPRLLAAITAGLAEGAAR